MLKSMNFRPRIVRAAPPPAGRSLKRLEFELALEVSDTGDRPLVELVRETAENAGGDLVFVLPTADPDNVSAIVRLIEDGANGFIQVNFGQGTSSFDIVDEGDIDAAVLQFARSSVDMLERLRSHRQAVPATPRAARAAG